MLDARPASEIATFALEPDQVRLYHDDGYLGPFTAVSADEMTGIRERIDTEVLATSGPAGIKEQSRHLDCRIIWDLCKRAEIVDRVKSIVGPDVVLWRTHFFNKEPGGKEIPWHQDFNYWPLEPALNISAWIAIDEVTIENSCVNLIPGSHKKTVPHIPSSTDKFDFEERADPAVIDLKKSTVVNMVLKPGQFFLFTERLLHQSNANVSAKRRLGLAMRMTVPIVRVDHDELFPGHRVLMLAGEDRMGFNRVGRPPDA